MPILDTTKDLAALFAYQVRATPDAVALEDESTALTYAELDREVGILAHRLRRSFGVGRDHLVGVLLDRSADYVIACLAALRAGGAFLVLELAYPAGLLGDVIEDARPTVVITKRAHRGQIKGDVPLIMLDDEGVKKAETDGVTTAPHAANGHAEESQIYSSPSSSLPPLPADDDLERLAFVSYSSGTTGRPKGIANPHRASVLSYDLRFQLSDLGPGDRVACNVFFVWEILRPLLRGATVVAVPDEASYDPVALVELLANRKITETLMTPTLLATVLARYSRLGARPPHLRTLWLNGEVVTADLARRALAVLPGARLLNCYSASETHEIACGDIKEMLEVLGDNITVSPVGPAMDPEHIYVLDEAGQKVHPGTSGELFVGGDLLARGYLNLPETTAKAFLPDPFDQTPGARMYRTGDLARVLPSGLLEITGRVGGLIKVRGYSIQPGAVETAIVKHLAVRDCVVNGHGDGLERQLVAYIVRDKEQQQQERLDIIIDDSGYSPVARRTLSAHLAHYMIPALWVELDELPTHEVSGKADLKSLPPPPKAKAGSACKTAVVNGVVNGVKSERENNTTIKIEAIAQMWAASLNTNPAVITSEHDFFDLGGHSLALADLASRMSKTFGFPVPLSPLAGNPTLNGHLEAVIAARDGHTAAVQADLPAVLCADSELPEDIRPAVAWMPMRALKDAKTVLLTGVTGFLGAFLLTTILESTEARVICLVRFSEPTGSKRPDGIARIRKNLLDLGLWQDSILERMEVLPGNLARKRLGLSEEAFEALAARVDVVVHAAATVNLVYPYAALRAANVGGTREILRLACLAGAPVHHISTNGVLPPSPLKSASDKNPDTREAWPETAMLDVDAVPQLLDGYGQTKWVAEQLVLEAGRRGLPVRIYRPGTISGHSELGSTNAWDLLMALVVESLHLGRWPAVEGWLAEMTPVDFVSKAIVSLASHTEAGQKKIFHLGDPQPVPARRVFGLLTDLGYPTEPLGWDEWVGLWAEKRGSSGAGSGRGGGDMEPFTADILRGGMPTSAAYLQSVTVLGDASTAPELLSCGIKRPEIDAALLETYARHYYCRGWLPHPPVNKNNKNHSPAAMQRPLGPLHGRIAIVTGASSGIGAATAIALAREGAKVALAARRISALEFVRDEIAAVTGGRAKVLLHQTDVTDRAQVEGLVAAAEAHLGGPVDILVACAGVMYYTMMANARVDEWDRTVDVNCKGLLHCLAAVVPGMLKRQDGGPPHIVAISSDAGRKAFPGLGVYSASKFFVEATLQSLRLETAGSRLRVTSVQPGNTDTGLLGMSTDVEAVKKYGEPSGAKVLDPGDVAAAIVYALTRPEHVAVNEVLIKPKDEPI